jgi:hypothetical protein
MHHTHSRVPTVGALYLLDTWNETIRYKINETVHALRKEFTGGTRDEITISSSRDKNIALGIEVLIHEKKIL